MVQEDLLMKKQPDFIDNIDGNTLASALKEFLKSETEDNYLINENTLDIFEARIATAYFSPGGFSRIAGLIKKIPKVKLLLGSDPYKGNEKWQRKLGESEASFLSRKLNDEGNNIIANANESKSELVLRLMSASLIELRGVEALQMMNCGGKTLWGDYVMDIINENEEVDEFKKEIEQQKKNKCYSGQNKP